MLTLTDSAQKAVDRFISSNETPVSGLRISVTRNRGGVTMSPSMAPLASKTVHRRSRWSFMRACGLQRGQVRLTQTFPIASTATAATGGFVVGIFTSTDALRTLCQLFGNSN